MPHSSRFSLYTRFGRSILQRLENKGEASVLLRSTVPVAFPQQHPLYVHIMCDFSCTLSLDRTRARADRGFSSWLLKLCVR